MRHKILQSFYYLLYLGMSFEKAVEDIFLKGHEKYLPHLSIDCVILGFHTNELRVLLLKQRNVRQWALPGGFIMKEEPIDEAARRILEKRTGLKNIYLKQFETFGATDRSSPAANQQFLKGVSIDASGSWLFNRFITIGYYALVEYSKVNPVPDEISECCEWFDVNNLPETIHDHGEILKKAWESLRLQLNYYPIGYNLLPEKFTLPELQKLYETILNRPLDRRNFHRKIMTTGILVRLNEVKAGVAHKAPFLYKFDLTRYNTALKTGLGFAL